MELEQPVATAPADLEHRPRAEERRPPDQRRVMPWIGLVLIAAGLMVAARIATPVPGPDPRAEVLDVSHFGVGAPSDGQLLVTTLVAGPHDRRAAAQAMQRSQHDALAAATECLGRSEPLVVALNDGGVGGASAGLMIAIALVDQLEQRRVSAERVVAGTGTITADGDVGPVLGVAAKAVAAQDAGADVFLVPVSQVAQADGATSGLMVVGIHTLDDALRTLTGTGCMR